MKDKKMEIYRCAKALFTEKGFKNTNVSEIMQRAGYATGSFYRFFPSKDHLFMEIYNEENIALKRRNMENIDIHRNPMLVMQEMMERNLTGMRNNPILREWYDRDTFAKIEKGFRESKGLENVDFFFQSFAEVVQIWQQEGRMRTDIDAGMIVAIFAALINIDMHKEEIGVQYFPDILAHIGTFIMQGLAGEQADAPKDQGHAQ